MPLFSEALVSDTLRMIWKSGFGYIAGKDRTDLEALGQQGVCGVTLWVRQMCKVLILP